MIFKFVLKTIKEIIDDIKNVFAEQVCSFCMEKSNLNLCDKCKYKMDEISDNLKCVELKNISDVYKKHIYISSYRDMERKYITDIKFRNKVYYIDSIIKRVNPKSLKAIKFDINDYDLFIYVPTDISSFFKRGCNISKYILKLIIKEFSKIEYNYNYNYNYKKQKENKLNNIFSIFKVIKKIEMKNVNKKERSKAAGEKFEINNFNSFFEILKIKTQKKRANILICDDVYTTGSTFNALINSLLKKVEENNIDLRKISITTFSLFKV